MKPIIFFIGILGVVLFSCQIPITTVTVQEKSKNAYLEFIAIDGERIANFRSDVFQYNIYRKVDENNSSATVTYQTVEVTAKVYCSQTDGVISLQLNQDNPVMIASYSEDGTVSCFYTVKINYYNDSCSLLKDLQISGQTIKDFSIGSFHYKYQTTQSQFTINAIPFLSNETITIKDGAGNFVTNGSTVTFADLEMIKTFTIDVTNGGNSSQYTLVVEKIEYSDGFYQLTDLSALFQQDKFTTVIAGDSLSVGYGFINGSGHANAWDTYSGMLSWSHMLRDAIHRNDPYFISADQVMIGAGSTDVVFTKSWSSGREDPALSYWMPFNNRNLAITNITKTDEEITIRYRNENHKTKKAVLWFSKTPSDVGCKFNIKLNGTGVSFKVYDSRGIVNAYDKESNTVLLINEVDTYSYSASQRYLGYEPIVVELDNLVNGDNVITLTGFENSKKQGASCGFFFLGIGSKYSPVYLNGKSGVTTDYYNDIEVPNGAFWNRLCVKSDSGQRVAPDALMLIIGANDSSNSSGIGKNGTDDGGVVKGKVSLEAYKNNLTSIVSKLKQLNPNIQILLISPPVWSDTTNYESQKILTLQYTEKMKEVALEQNCMFLDTINLLDNLPINTPAVPSGAEINWRVDQIHFTKFGNTFMAKNLAEKLMPQGIYPKKMVDADMVFNEWKNDYIPEHGWGIFEYDVNSDKFVPVKSEWNYTGNYIRSIKRDKSKMNITLFPTKEMGLPQLSVEQFGEPTLEFYTRIDSFWSGYQNFWLLKRGVGQYPDDIILTDQDFKTNANSLKFRVSW